MRVMLLSYESEPLPTRFRSASEVLEFRDNAWQKYFTNQNFLSLVEKIWHPTKRKFN